MSWTQFLFSVNGRISRASLWLKFFLPVIVILYQQTELLTL